jgi:hypothetical protein
VSNLAKKMIREKCLKVNQRNLKVFSGAHDVERLPVVNRGDDLSYGCAPRPSGRRYLFWPDEAAIVIALGCDVREMSDDHDSAAERHCCYMAEMEMVVGGNQSSHQCRCY